MYGCMYVYILYDWGKKCNKRIKCMYVCMYEHLYIRKPQIIFYFAYLQGLKLRGRVYVCDLAGTEPAGDIVYALYEKISFDDGSFEYKFKGAHSDMKKTKELQEQVRFTLPVEYYE